MSTASGESYERPKQHIYAEKILAPYIPVYTVSSPSTESAPYAAFIRGPLRQLELFA